MTHDPAPRWGVLGDMDGTLLDTESTWLRVIERFVNDHDGADAVGLAAASEGLDLDRAAALLSERLDLREPQSAIALDLDRRALAAYAESVTWRPGAPALLRALTEASVPLALVTSSPRHWVDRFAESVDLSAFRVSITADDSVRTKPAPDPYLDGAAALGLDAGRCVVLEDSQVGAWSAVSAGCTTVVVGDPARSLPPGVHRVSSLEHVDVGMLQTIVQRSAAS
ncbi:MULTISPECIES: HAD family hydrolase [unclassified Microbacterium]|uniref:HAD family hydrolase n=1 Tax=unclassified Microbacterium TaxID=2609290 RepID=UPI0034256502